MMVRIWKFGRRPADRETVHTADLSEPRLHATVVIGEEEFDLIEQNGALLVRCTTSTVVYNRNPVGNEVLVRVGEP